MYQGAGSYSYAIVAENYYENNIYRGGNKHEIIKMLSMRQHRGHGRG